MAMGLGTYLAGDAGARRRGRNRFGWLGAASVAPILLLSAGLAHAQAIERNLPPAPKSGAPEIAEPNLSIRNADSTPIGPALTGIDILGEKDEVSVAPTPGINVSHAPRLAGAEAALRRYLGRPLSKHLIAEIETQIALIYRSQGHPFVNLSTPPQELTGGVLQVRVIEFKLDKKTAPGATPSEAGYIKDNVRATPGEDINVNDISQDLDWLNRYPFHTVQAVFSPSSQPGETDLALTTKDIRPFSVYGGYADSGSPSTSFDRYILGTQFALPFLHDAFVSYQYTGSNSSLFYGGGPFNSSPDPSYVSHAGRIYIPTLPRQDLEMSVDYVQTYAPSGKDLNAKLSTLEASAAYRSALSDFVHWLPGEALVGFEAKSLISTSYFNGASVAEHGINVFQILVGYSYSGYDAAGHTALDINAHISPGGVDGRDNNTSYDLFSGGHFVHSSYAYLNGDLTRVTNLPKIFGVQGMSLVTQIVWQYAGVVLPLSEDSGLGGQPLVRGYTLDDGAADTAFIDRSELHGPVMKFLYPNSYIAPYIFFDTGYGYNNYTNKPESLQSTGFAADFQLTSHLTATMDGAWALRSAGFTRAGDGRFDIRLTAAF